MIWPFRRKPKPRIHLGSTSVDWQPGDMAECISGCDTWAGGRAGPVCGDRLMVADVVYGNMVGGIYKGFGLYFVGRWSAEAYQADQFRKIVLTDTGADRKVCKRKPTRVDA